MAINPMQRKARNSFLLGMLLMLVIAGAIVALLILQLKNYKDKEQAELAASVSIYTLNQDVKSGQVITSDMLEQQTGNRNLVPQDAIGDLTTFENYNLQDKAGNQIRTEYNDDDEPEMKITIGGRDYTVEQEENTENYFYTDSDNQKQYIELNSVPIVAKVAMTRNTILTRETVTSAENISTNDVRQQEYNMIILPTQIETGDYIDIRIALPSGPDYIVVAKKEVTVPDVAGVPSLDTIWVNLSEDEILLLSNAIVEAYRIDGARLYANIYTEPGMQEASQITYTPNGDVARLISENPNIVQDAKTELQARYSTYQRNNVINSAIINSENGDENVSTRVQEDAQATQDQRQEYLEGLASSNTATTTNTTTTE